MRAAQPYGRAPYAMRGHDPHEFRFQCPNCGSDLRQTVGRLKASEPMICPACHVGINIDTNTLADAAEEIQKGDRQGSARDYNQIFPIIACGALFVAVANCCGLFSERH